jgi:hypothetical protein
VACASVGDAVVAPLPLPTTVLVASVVPDLEAVDVRVCASVADEPVVVMVVLFAYTYPE